MQAGSQADYHVNLFFGYDSQLGCGREGDDDMTTGERLSTWDQRQGEEMGHLLCSWEE